MIMFQITVTPNLLSILKKFKMKLTNDITILYVEDEKGVRDSVADILKIICEKLYIAYDGMEGLDLYKLYIPDIVISDIRMPNMDGITMASKIKDINESQHIIFTSAHSDDKYFIEAIELQVDGYILKPINMEKLENKILSIAKHIKLKKDFEKQKAITIQADKLSSMKVMIENIAHQWRQPLCSISTDATGLLIQKQMGKLSDDNFTNICENINHNAIHLSDTIDALSEFIKDENKSEKFNLKDATQSVLSLLDATILENNIKIINTIKDDIFITSLQNEFKQALINILINTKDALLLEKNKFIFIDIETKNNSVVLNIKDNGGGMDEYILTKIFEPYFTTKHQSRGTGLGLYVSFDIISNILQGTLEVENKKFIHNDKEYKGAQFIVTLPFEI